MFNFLSRFIKTKPHRIINQWEHQGWGDAIHFINYREGTITGHMTPLPEVGDELRVRMKSGGIGRFKIVSVEPCHDPVDMFFGQAKGIGYTKNENR